MPDIQLESELTLDEDEEIAPSKASISVASLPRQALQKIIALNPIAKANPAQVKPIPATKALRAEPHVEKTIIDDIKNLASNAVSPIIELTTQVKLISEQPALSLKDRFIKNLESLKKEWEEVKADPLAYLRNSASKLIDNSLNLVSSLYTKTKNTWNNIVSAVVSFFETQETQQEAAPTTTLQKSTNKTGIAQWLNLILPIGTNNSSAQKNTIDLLGASQTEEGLVISSEKPKGLFELLVEGLKQLSIDLQAKKEEEHKTTLEKQIEEKERLEKEAKERLKKAEELRPDLADEIDLPSSEFIFQSAFNELPDVATLIELAEKRKLAKQSN